MPINLHVLILIVSELVKFGRSELNMEIDHLKNVSTKLRTTFIKHLWVSVIVFVCIKHSSAVHIDFDDVETSWLKNIAVYALPVSDIENQSIPLLKITGISPADIEDGVHIRPTFSATDCIGNDTDLQIVNATESSNNIKTDLFISLLNFDFKQYASAYLCIKTKYDHHFQHMGHKSKFSK